MKKILSTVMVLAMMLSAVNATYVSAEDGAGKIVGIAAELKAQSDRNPIVALRSFGGQYNLVGYMRTDISGLDPDFIDNVKIVYPLTDRMGNYWAYDDTLSYAADVDQVINEWKIGDEWPVYLSNTFVAEPNVAVLSKAGEKILKADVTENVLAALENGAKKISYRFTMKDTAMEAYVDDSGFMGLEVEYIGDEDILIIINSAEGAEDIEKALLSGVFSDNSDIEAYAALNNREAINNALAGRTYSSLNDFITAFEDAYADYLANPDDKDAAGRTICFPASLVGQSTRTNPITDLIFFGAENNLYAYIRTNISEIDPKYIKKVRLVYPLSERYGSIWSYDENTSYQSTVNQISNGWQIGDGWNVHLIDEFTLKTNVAQMTNAGNRTLKADVTENVFSEISKGEENVSYRIIINDTAMAAYYDVNGFIGLEAETINDYETLELINAAENAQDIEEILNSGLFNDNETYKKYSQLNNKNVINNALLGSFSSYDAFITAFKNAYEDYIINPSYEDKAGLTKSINNFLYGRLFTNNQNPITTDYACMGNYGVERALIKFDLSDVDFDFVKKATLNYATYSSYSSWYHYNSIGDYTTRVDRTGTDWDIGSVADSDFNSAIKEHIATAYASDADGSYAILEADITDDLKTNGADENGIVSYRLSKDRLEIISNGEDTKNRYIIDDKTLFTIVIEYLNEYEMLQKYNEVKNDTNALMEYISEVAKIEEISGVNPSFAAIYIAGRTFASYEDLIDAISKAGQGGAMIVSDADVTVGENVTGTFKIRNFSEGTEDSDPDLCYAIVASYNENGQMIDSFIADDQGAELEVSKMIYDEDAGEYVPGESDEIAFTLAGGADTVKVFIWENFETMKPMGIGSVIYSR